MEYAVTTIVLSVIAGLIVLGLRWAFRRVRRSRAVHAPDEAALTPEFLFGLFDGRTTAQAEILLRDHVGKPMTVTGDIRDIEPSFPTRGGLWVTIALPGFEWPGRSLTAMFDKSWVERISARRKGETITVTGSVSAVWPTHLSLDHCRIPS